MKIIPFFLIFLVFLSKAFAVGESFTFGQDSNQSVFVNNRILAKVNGKAISVVDIMKKMDMLFYKQFPQYTSSTQARYQFYKVNWKQVLQELIDKELIMADAEEHKVPVSNGDVRQEMEMTFGPNIISNLDKIGLTFDEAWQMIKDDIVIRRMIYLNVNAKVLKKVTPQDVKESYEKYAKENVKKEEWQYQVVTLRNNDPEKGKAASIKVRSLLVEEKKPIIEIANESKNHSELQDCKISVSELFRHGEKDISPQYKEVLEKLENNHYSDCISQKSKKDNSVVYRVFYLKEKTPAGAPPFHEVKNDIETKLLDAMMNDETHKYIVKLRNHYHVQEHLNLLAHDFEPFILR